MRRALLTSAAIGSVVAVAAGLWWSAVHDRSIAFLPHRAPAEWVVYPKPPVPYRQAVAELPTLFRKTVHLEQVPSSATLTICAFRRYVVSINDRFVALPQTLRNWKNPTAIEVSKYLKDGGNEIRVTVFNNFGPPALWLNLSGVGLRDSSDASWETSFAGAVWRPALLATQTTPVAMGNPLDDGEECLPALRASWRTLSTLLTGSLLLLTGASYWFGRSRAANLLPRWKWTDDPVIVLLVGTVVLWVILFTHNLSFLPRLAGFDSQGHLEYIQYILVHGKLPLASDGWEMHQPPFYYLMTSAVLKCVGLGPMSFDGITLLRLISLLIGLAHLILAFFSLRLLFPGSTGAQMAGLLLAGFLPMQLYLTHFITNEGLSAFLMSATLLLVLRILRAPRISSGSILAAGLCLGLALLTKITAVVLAPFVFSALAYRLARSDLPVRGRWMLFLGASGICLCVCGWHYFRVWRHFGNPLMTNWDPTLPFAWWQDPGYRTAAWFTKFGRSLRDPFFSGLSSFSDGIYSTLWGDGLWSGTSGRMFRPSWNYNLMAAGFLLALVPSFLILAGIVRGWRAVFQRVEPAWCLLVGVTCGLVVALIQLNLTVPSYASAKAFYLLSGMLPLIAFAAIGWEGLSLRLGVFRHAVAVLLLWWALSGYFACWIQSDSPVTQRLMARERMRAGNHESAFAYLSAALRQDPRNLDALSLEVNALISRNQIASATAVAERMVAEHPREALAHLELAKVLDNQGKSETAVEQTVLAVEAATDDPEARLQLVRRLSQSGRVEAAVVAGREALRLAPTDPEIHFLIGRALLARSVQPDASAALCGGESLWPMRTDSFTANDFLAAEALNHFRFAASLAPESPDALNQLAFVLATDPRAELRAGPEAVQLAKKACALTEFKNPNLLETLAVSFAEDGKYDSALETLQRAEMLSGQKSDSGQQKVRDQMKQLFLANRPYRQPQPGSNLKSN